MELLLLLVLQRIAFGFYIYRLLYRHYKKSNKAKDHELDETKKLTEQQNV